jgi:TRAP transporter TAXI family solute receptor
LLVAPFTLNAQSAGRKPATGIDVKKPVLGGACKICPWGALGEIVKQMLAPEGYDVQMCYNCNRADAPRIVADAKVPPPYEPDPVVPEILAPRNAPGLGPVDFGITSVRSAWAAYQGTGGYSGEEPRTNLRLIANIQQPNYLLLAVRTETGITDLSQVREKKWPVKILARGRDMDAAVLDYYGLSPEAVEEAGGRVSGSRATWDDFDIVIYPGGAMTTAPEWAVWANVSLNHDLTFLQLPDDLIEKIAEDNELMVGTIPVGLYPGVVRPIKTVVRTGHLIYGRDDMPDDFAYTLAKAIDERQELLQWSHLPFSYNVHTVWKAEGIPLHPGAERYYKKRGYMK